MTIKKTNDEMKIIVDSNTKSVKENEAFVDKLKKRVNSVELKLNEIDDIGNCN